MLSIAARLNLTTFVTTLHFCRIYPPDLYAATAPVRRPRVQSIRPGGPS
jgi:hypothetical protein